ncbi:hypothetical protein GH714_005670 [Hevea brasiliensis]|uniref:Uncharacterized protein n=1 Tax=Hevea brasiliensis TaxID=3981 RepID=A0A6A6MXY9_HEVBR|nr:hypothetical protein GH714_005670 [Hevea brasiliensis]
MVFMSKASIVGGHYKLKQRKHGPFKITKKINDNVYAVDLSYWMGNISKTLNVVDLYSHYLIVHLSGIKDLRGSLESTNHLYVLGLGPDMRVAKYSGIIVNGIRFHNIERDKYRHTQNSGIVVKGEHNSKEIDFYGELTDIIELEHCHGNCVYVFKCNWWNIGDKKNGSRTYDQLMSVNVNRKWSVEDPFVLANQASQAFYINDIKNGSGWKIVQKSYPRNVYGVPENEGIDNERFDFNEEPYQQYEINDGNVIEQIDNQDIESLHHDDEILEEIDATTILSRNSRKSSEDTISDDSTDEEDDTIIDYCVSDADDKEEDDNDEDNYDEEDDDDF